MSLKITDCKATPSVIVVSFSEDISKGSATESANYTVVAGAATFVGPSLTKVPIHYDAHDKSATITLATPLTKGQGVLVTATVAPASPSNATPQTASFGTNVNGGDDSARQDARRATKAVEDAVSYPLLTGPVNFPTSGGGPATGATSGGSGASLDSRAAMAVTNVLGWKVNNSDAKGFVGAITQAFTLTEVEGHTESAWNPRTYAVQTDLGGGMIGAQASLYTRAKDAVQQSLQLIDNLYPLDPDADPEYVKALREMAKSQMNEILLQFGSVGGPSILRVNTYFQILLGQSHAPTEFNPDKVGGTLGQLRDTYGIYFTHNPFSNSIDDEQDLTNFRLISDYMTSLLQSWLSNKEFFELGGKNPAFFGTQLVLLSRQLSVIVDTVNEVRFTLDSVFIGAAERQSLLLEFSDRNVPPMFVEDILQEIQDFASDEAPRLLQDGGKISVRNNILPVMENFQHLVQLAHSPANRVPDGYRTVRVQRSFDDLSDQLGALMGLAGQVVQRIPPPMQDPDVRLTVVHVMPITGTASHSAQTTIFGSDFWPGIQVHFKGVSTNPPNTALQLKNLTVLSANLLVADVTIPVSAIDPYYYDVDVLNPDGRTFTLPGGLKVTAQ